MQPPTHSTGLHLFVATCPYMPISVIGCCLVVLLQVVFNRQCFNAAEEADLVPCANSLHSIALYGCYLDVDVCFVSLWLLQSACTCLEL